VTAVAAAAAAVVAGSSFPHLQIVPCEFNVKIFRRRNTGRFHRGTTQKKKEETSTSPRGRRRWPQGGYLFLHGYVA
jgi:hypothetical protein